MVATVNAAHVFKEYPDESMPVPGRTTETVKGEIDLDTVPLDGGVLIRTLVLAMDPYLRNKMQRSQRNMSFKIGEALTNHGVGLVLRSEHSAFPVGAHVCGFLPFTEYSVKTDPTSLRVLPENTGLPWTVWVGAAGMPGQTAYNGWKEHSHAKKGETVFVSGGAGAVGSFVIQLAKQDGLKVIASAGTDEKVLYLKDIGADVAFNYKTTSTVEVLEKEGPIDIYYDNVGGPTLDAALMAANVNARFIICGAISGYNKNEYGIKNMFEAVLKSITISGFSVSRLAHKYQDEFYATVPSLLQTGKVRYQEHRYHGLDSTCQALVDVLTGKNKGKAVIIVADEGDGA